MLLTCLVRWVLILSLAGLVGHQSADAQDGPFFNVRQTTLQAGATGAVMELHGLVRLTAAGKPVEKRFVLRYPETRSRWNGALVIGAHGGGGGDNYSRDGKVIGTDENALDDVIGQHAVAHGFAYASVDRDGIGGAREGLALTYQFTDVAAEQLVARMGRAPATTYVVGLSAGGSIARLAAEDPAKRYAGVLLIAGGNGDLPTRLDRQAALAVQWPGIDPKTHPGLSDTDSRVRAYADAIGTPVAARRLWPYTSTGATVAGVRRTLDQYGLTGLSDDQVRAFRVRDHASNAAFMDKVKAENTTGALKVPTIEVVGTWDDLVISEIRAYKKKATASLHRLYQVEGAWHMSPDDDGVASFQYIAEGRMGLGPDVANAMGEGTSYLPIVRESFDQLVRWVSNGEAPAADRTVKGR
jgi:pimeloyl-ACP methyl ester carboxylesterase